MAYFEKLALAGTRTLAVVSDLKRRLRRSPMEPSMCLMGTLFSSSLKIYTKLGCRSSSLREEPDEKRETVNDEKREDKLGQVKI
jgi:hypothetical protein